MKIKEQRFNWVDPKLPPEQQAEIMKTLEQKALGYMQGAKGKLRKELTEDFLSLFD